MDAMTRDQIETDDYEETDYSDVDHRYVVYPFETPIYLYIWQILVILTCICNVAVLSVLLRKNMRKPASMILVALSISDSLTGLVTLPTYIAVFDGDVIYGKTAPVDMPLPPSVNTSEIRQKIYSLNITEEEKARRFEEFMNHFNRQGSVAHSKLASEIASQGSTFLSEELCDWFMTSKYFLSKSFHIISIWITVLLALQRYIAGAYALKAQHIFTMKKTVIMCVVIFISAPILLIYHPLKSKSPDGHCKWTVEMGADCDADCIYLWCEMLFGHLAPCLAVAVSTIYFIFIMRRSSDQLEEMNSCATTVNTGLQTRMQENKRAVRVVTAILIVFLIPELPYAVYLLYVTIFAHVEKDMDLETNRAIQASYEILLVMSFSANFFIYTCFNKKFRDVLVKTILLPVYGVMRSGRRFSFAPHTETSVLGSSTGGVPSTDQTELNTIIKSQSDEKDKNAEI